MVEVVKRKLGYCSVGTTKLRLQTLFWIPGFTELKKKYGMSYKVMPYTSGGHGN